MRLIKYLIHQALWERLPMLPRQYSVDYDTRTVDQDTATLMAQSHIRCPHGVEILKRRHSAATARQLITTLPSRRRRRRPVAQRVLSLIRHAFGLLPYDPMKLYARRYGSRSR